MNYFGQRYFRAAFFAAITLTITPPDPPMPTADGGGFSGWYDRSPDEKLMKERRERQNRLVTAFVKSFMNIPK